MKQKLNQASVFITGLFLLCLSSCAPDKSGSENTTIEHSSSPDADANQQSRENPAPLNIELPSQQLSAAALDQSDIATEAKNDTSVLPDLFEDKNKADKKMEVSAKPHLKMGEAATELPEVSGASVTVKVKTD